MTALLLNCSAASTGPRQAFYVSDVGTVTTTPVPATVDEGQPSFQIQSGDLRVLVSPSPVEGLLRWELSYDGPETVVDEPHTDWVGAPLSLTPGNYTYTVKTFMVTGATVTTTGSFTIA